MILFNNPGDFLLKNYPSGFSVLALILVLTVNSFAAKGNFDRTFGDWGKTISPVFGTEKAQDAAVQPDGKIVVVGSAASPDENFDFLIQRYNPDGALDETFGNAGKVKLEISWQAEAAFSVVLQADGKIVVGGYINQASGFSDYCLVRLLPDGEGDPAFGEWGVKIIPVTTASDNIAALAIQNLNGAEKIIVGGTVSAGNSQFSLARLNADGSLDASFGEGGVKNVAFGLSGDVLHDIAVDGAGKIVAAGYSRFNTGSGFREDFAVARFTPDGQLDASFSGDGKQVTQMGLFGQARSVVVQNVGGEERYVVGGFARSGANDFALARYKNNGDLDTTFGTSGKTFTDFAGQEEQIHELLLAGDKIYGVGFMNFGPNYNFAAARYNANGLLDKNFASCGKLTSDLGTNSDIAYGATLQPDGKILAVGETNNFGATNADFTVVRYTPGGQASATDADFDGDGKEDVSVYRPSDGTWYANCTCQGFRAVRFGLANDRPAPADYDGDGRTDQAIYRAGTWYIFRSSDNRAAIINFGLETDVPTVGDYDGDDKADISVWRGSTGVWYVLRSADLQYTATAFGQAGDKPVPADYDGDGKTDLAIYRGSGDWWIKKSSDASGNLTFQKFGIETDAALPRDFDGDGRADLNIYRASEGNWYQSFTNSVKVTRFGNSADKPAPADFDGDGKADIAVFRGGVWHILSSSNNAYRVVNFGLNGDVPTVAG